MCHFVRNAVQDNLYMWSLWVPFDLIIYAGAHLDAPALEPRHLIGLDHDPQLPAGQREVSVQ